MRRQVKVLANFLGAAKNDFDFLCPTLTASLKMKIARQLEQVLSPSDDIARLSMIKIGLDEILAQIARLSQGADKSSKPSIVYAIRDERGRVKIGRTANLKTRYATLQTTSPSKLTIIWRADGGIDHENLLHKHFSRRREQGEWFDFSGMPIPDIIHMLSGVANATARNVKVKGNQALCVANATGVEP